MKRKSSASLKSQSQLLPVVFVLGVVLSSTAIFAYQKTGLFELNETNETYPVAPPVEEKPILDITVESPEKITRGEVIEVKAVISNIGSIVAKNVLVIWKLPEGFEIVSGTQTENCGTLEPNASCTSVITVQTSFSAELGINEIKVVVSYETQ